jgi:hypothetical protein
VRVLFFSTFLIYCSFNSVSANDDIVEIRSSGEKIICNRGSSRTLTDEEKEIETKSKTKIECPFYSCKGDKGNNFVYLDVKNSTSILIKNIPGVIDLVNDWESKNGEEFISKKSQRNGTVFTNYNMFLSLEEKYSICNGFVSNILKEQIKLKKDGILTLATANLVEAVSIVNGSIKKNIYEMSGLNPGGCFYGQIYIDPNLTNEIQKFHEQLEYKRTVKRPLSFKEAEDIFNKVASRKDMPWKWSDGCYARAHVITNELAYQGIEVDKIWVTSNIQNPNTNRTWNFHVAPIIYVEENGKTVRYVIDPAVASKPVTEIEWLNLLRNSNSSGIAEINFPIPLNFYVPGDLTVFAISPKEFYGNELSLGNSLSNTEAYDVSKAILKGAVEDLQYGRKPGYTFYPTVHQTIQ